ncbi:meckelin [Paragonimus westermani]|uniref:Meckelin n=1 Tax=Paragonimus westermani TaxID=34504 RepID=A0A5J4NTY1_9TREM|nr:meckelin [Paragonimus westermani]
MPWLYYSPTKASTALKDTSITAQYSPKAQVDIRLATFALDGTFLGFENATEFGHLQLCKDTIGKMQAAFSFGTVYSQELSLNLDRNYVRLDLYFFDGISNIGKLMPIPVLNRALVDNAGVLTNVVSEEDANSLTAALTLGNAASVASIESAIRDKWELTRRLFLVDSLSGRVSDAVTPATLVRYASNIELKIFPRGSGFDGLIYPPLLAVDYDNLYSAEDFGKNKRVKVAFSVTYDQPTELEAVFEQNLRIAMGVICTLAACYGMIRTWLWSRRAGVLRLDGMLILKLLLFVVGNVANGFLIVIYCISIYFLIFYKLQTSFMVNLPNSDQFMVNYIAAAFALKCLDIAHLMAVQCTVDIFFMDWERPKFPSSKLMHRTGVDGPDLHSIGILQWFLLIVVWERCFEDKLRSFADLCSITNVSVFVLAQANFGYYIHGHCPTGSSDVDMGGLELMLATERSGNAPRRGIMADSDRHTYRMALPAALRKAFDRLYAPLLDISTSGPSRGPLDSVHYTTLNDVYQTLNRFLMRFISRDNTEGIRFKIVRKRALEDLLDGEFDDTTLEGLFYVVLPSTYSSEGPTNSVCSSGIELHSSDIEAEHPQHVRHRTRRS